MDEPSKIIDANFEGLEKWVADEFDREPGTYIKSPTLVLNPLPLETKFKIIDQDWTPLQTSGNQNDCMIHSLLMDSSLTFRQLDDESKNIMAHFFRNYPFLQIVSDYFQGNSELALIRNTITSNVFLKQEYLIAICNHCQFNILIFSAERRREDSAERRREDSAERRREENNPYYLCFENVLEDNIIEDKNAIVMYNDSGHFSAACNNVNFDLSFVNFFEVIEQIQNLYSSMKDHKPICEYKDGDIFYNKDEVDDGPQWVCTGRTFQNGHNNCISLKIQTNDGTLIYKEVPIRFFNKSQLEDGTIINIFDNVFFIILYIIFLKKL